MSALRPNVAHPLDRAVTDSLAAAIGIALRPQVIPTSKWRLSAALMLAALSLAPGMSHAQSQWQLTANGGVGNWTTAGNWLNGLPNVNSEADIGATTAGTAQLIGSGASGITGVLFAGRTAQGEVDIEAGGILTSSDSRIGNNAGVLGTVTVQDFGSQWTSGQILLGVDGHGRLYITGGGKVTSTSVTLGDDLGSQGDVLVGGLDSSWSTGNLLVGNSGIGTIEISDDGLITSGSSTIGSGPGSVGNVNVLGGGTWTDTGGLVVGGAGTGTLHIGTAGAGLVTSASGVVGGTGLGHVNVDGTGALWAISGALQLNNGEMNIINGGAVSDGDSAIDPLVGSAVSVYVNGPGSAWTNGGLLTVGGLNEGLGTLNITNPGSVSADSVVIGNHGLINVSGTGAPITNLAVANSLSVGIEGTTGNGGAGGSLSIASGGLVHDATGVVGVTAGSAGSVTVDGAGSTWSNTGLLDVGAVATGVLTVQAGAHAVVTASGGTTNVGALFGATGNVTVTGSGSLVDSPTINVGDAGTGALNILANGVVHDTSANIGSAAGAVGQVTVDGLGAWNTDTELDVGVSGNGALTVQNDGKVNGATVNLASATDGVGHVIVNGAGSLVHGTGQINVGGVGAGTLDIQAGGVVHGASGRIGVAAGSSGQATIDGAFSGWNTDNELDVGVGGTGTLTLQNGGFASGTAFVLGSAATGIGTVTVNGSTSGLLSSSQIGVGSAGKGTLLVQAGGTVHGHSGNIGTAVGSSGQATVDGAGSVWNNDTELDVGANGNGALDVSNGGQVTDQNGFIGHNSGTGQVTVDGAGSLWMNNTNVTVADVGHGTLTLSNGGAVQTTNGIFVALSSGSTGTVNIGADTSSAPVAPGTLSGNVAFGSGTGRLNFNHTDTAYNFASSISGGASGTVNVVNGTTILSGASTYTGATNVTGGKLIVNGSLGNTSTSVLAGTLGGTGSVAGPVHVFSGAHLAPGQGAGTLTTGALTLDSGSLLDYDLGTSGVVGGGVNDLLEVHGNLVLDGSLNITDIGGFGAGVYRLIDYTGTLTDNTLDLGTLPGGSNANNLFVQTSVAGQVNLINNEGLLLGFWDGAVPGGLNNGAIEGGSGTWDASNNDWTDANGSIDGAWTDGQFAVFGGAAGTVDVVGQRGIAGLQFMSNYTLNATAGNGLVITGADSMIRVDPGMQATINAVISGGGGLDKSDAGTLVLGGINTYTGGTTVHGGVLSVNADDNLGAAGTQVTLDGGTLSVAGTSYNTTARAFTLGANGGSLDIADAGNTFNLAQTVDGSGGLTKLGAGTLVLGGANTYAGGTTVQSGVLSVSADNNLGAATGGLTLNGTILQVTGTAFNTTARNVTLVNGGGIDIVDAGNTLDVTQTIGGSGGLTKLGAGTLVLDGANTYTGGTTVQSGVLSVSADDNLGAATGGLALNGTTLQVTGTAFNTTARNLTLINGGSIDIVDAGNTLDVTQPIAGNGGLTKLGAGTLALSGVNSYTGGTTVQGGTLSVAADSNLGDATGGVALNGGTLRISGTAFNTTARSITLGADGGSLDIADAGNVFTLAGSLGGSGSFTKLGVGTLIFGAGSNGYTGATTIAEGTLQGDSSTLQGTITNHAALVFNQAGDGIFAGTIGGEGSVTKSGAGILVFNDANTLTGTTTVTGGGLVVGDDAHANASLGGNVVIDAGSSIGGIGSLGGLDLAGTLSPGNSIGTLHVAGDASFEKGSTFQVEATPDGQADRLDVAGKVAILGGSALVLGQDGNWAPRTDYTIITAGQGVTGQFDGVTDNLAFLAPSLSYGAKAVTLTLSRNSVDFTTVAQTPNQRATAGAAEALGVGQPVYDALEKLDAPSARIAFDQLSGEIHASTRTALIDDSRYVREAINRHLLGMDDGAHGSTANGASVWTSVTGHWGDYDGDSNVARLQANGSGLLVGADTGIGDDARLGAIVGHGQNSLQLDGRVSSAHVTADQLGFYGSTTFGPLALRAGAAYSWQDIDATRRPAFGDFAEVLESSGHARTGQVYVEGGYRFTSDAGNQLEPFVNAAHVQLHTDATHESGGAAALTTAGDSSAVNTAVLGLRDSMQLGAGSASLHGSLGWQQAWGDLTPFSTMRFAGGDSFAISGVPLARHAVVADAGLSFRIASNLQVDASYMGRFAAGSRDQGARMSLTMTF
jgi:T5SS/PEP-CTERM-associated repeat protein/autotransporter-associated beta strand protein